MAIGDQFDPATHGWFFNNWGEPATLSWDLFRRTYLAINPTQDLIGAPLDCAFFEIFKKCADGGNCGGISLLGLALFKYGGFMGFCSPASFYTGTTMPDRLDLHAAINIMQARQFSAPGIQNFLDVSHAGQLNDGEAAFARIKSGLASGDYAVLSLATGIAGDFAHTVIPFRADETTTGTKVLHVWDPNFPFDDFPSYYTGDHNKVIITSPTTWMYDQTAGGLFPGGTLYTGTGPMGGWCFAIPMSLELHKARHPFSPGFILTSLTTLFVSGSGAAVTQIEDDTGRRFYSSNRVHRHRTAIETDRATRLQGVVKWPWFATGTDGEPPGELFFLQRPPGSPALTVTVRGEQYSLVKAQAGNLLEVQAASSASSRDTVRVEDFTGDAQALELHTDGAKRRFDVHQLRADGTAGDWRSVHITDAHVDKADLRIQTRGRLDAVEVSSLHGSNEFDAELRNYRAKTLAKAGAGRHRVAAGAAVRLAPRDWNALGDTPVESRTRAL
jgi:hypothetical protein